MTFCQVRFDIPHYTMHKSNEVMLTLMVMSLSFSISIHKAKFNEVVLTLTVTVMSFSTSMHKANEVMLTVAVVCFSIGRLNAYEVMLTATLKANNKNSRHFCCTVFH